MTERCHFCGGPMTWDSDATGDDGELEEIEMEQDGEVCLCTIDTEGE